MTGEWEVLAGRMFRQGTQLSADRRKGTLRVQADSDQAEITWTERTSARQGPAELRQGVNFGKAHFSVIKAGASVLELKVAEGSAEVSDFFWLQEASMRESSAVESAVGRLNTILAGAQPQEDTQMPSAGNIIDSTAAPQSGSQPLQTALSGSETTATSSEDAFAASTLAALLSNISAPQAGSNAEQNPQALAAMLAAAFGQQQVVGPSLDKIVKPDLLVSLLDRIHDPAQVKELVQHLPVQHQSADTKEQLRLALQSPAFAQQLKTISHLLKTGQLTMAQIGLAGEGSSALDLLEAIQAQGDRRRHALKS